MAARQGLQLLPTGAFVKVNATGVTAKRPDEDSGQAEAQFDIFIVEIKWRARCELVNVLRRKAAG
jgi:hypothetical protein